MTNKNIFFAKEFLMIAIISVLLFGCSNKVPDKGSPEYISGIKEWHNKRVENLKKENGWLNLAGLYWLKPGENTFGTSPGNDIIFPKGSAPGKIGSLFLQDSIVTVKINDGIEVTSNSNPVKKMRLMEDVSGNPTVLNLGFLRWFVIKRGDKYGVRLRDLDAELVKEFPGIETYPIDQDWQISATFVKYDPPKSITIPTIIGTVDEEKSPGTLLFSKDGQSFMLDAVEEGDEFFIIFADETSGEETYGAGRFLYTAKPDSSGQVILDFNKVYNPPCAFTKYATCPLPPKQNYLKLKVTAGEKNFGHH